MKIRLNKIEKALVALSFACFLFIIMIALSSAAFAQSTDRWTKGQERIYKQPTADQFFADTESGANDSLLKRIKSLSNLFSGNQAPLPSVAKSPAASRRTTNPAVTSGTTGPGTLPVAAPSIAPANSTSLNCVNGLDCPAGSAGCGAVSSGCVGGMGGCSGGACAKIDPREDGFYPMRLNYMRSSAGAGAQASTQPTLPFDGSDIRTSDGTAVQGFIDGGRITKAQMYSRRLGIPRTFIKFGVPSKMQENEIYNRYSDTTGWELTDTAFQAISLKIMDQWLGKLTDPQRIIPVAQAAGQAQALSLGNACADAARNQAASAIEYCSSYLYNFTVEPNNKWNKIRDTLFIPIAVLLLLPGAVLSQVKAVIAQGSPVVGYVNPFDGLLRTVIAIFSIPATYLVVNYGIDLSNSITYTISSEYKRRFDSDMYKDAMAAEVRATPARKPVENRNAVDLPTVDMTPLVCCKKTPFAEFEGRMIENKIEDPSCNLCVVPRERADEALSSGAVATRLSMMGANAGLATSWNILCAFQMAYLYYLWFVGPIAAALWVWPMKQLQNALPNWIEGVVTLCFWSLFWHTVVLLMACFKGVDETGTMVMTALNFLSTACVKYAFDFAGLVKAAGQEAASKALNGQNSGGQNGGGSQQPGTGADTSTGNSGDTTNGTVDNTTGGTGDSTSADSTADSSTTVGTNPPMDSPDPEIAPPPGDSLFASAATGIECMAAKATSGGSSMGAGNGSGNGTIAPPPYHCTTSAATNNFADATFTYDCDTSNVETDIDPPLQFEEEVEEEVVDSNVEISTPPGEAIRAVKSHFVPRVHGERIHTASMTGLPPAHSISSPINEPLNARGMISNDNSIIDAPPLPIANAARGPNPNQQRPHGIDALLDRLFESANPGSATSAQKSEYPSMQTKSDSALNSVSQNDNIATNAKSLGQDMTESINKLAVASAASSAMASPESPQRSKQAPPLANVSNTTGNFHPEVHTFTSVPPQATPARSDIESANPIAQPSPAPQSRALPAAPSVPAVDQPSVIQPPPAPAAPSYAAPSIQAVVQPSVIQPPPPVPTPTAPLAASVAQPPAVQPPMPAPTPTAPSVQSSISTPPSTLQKSFTFDRTIVSTHSEKLADDGDLIPYTETLLTPMERFRYEPELYSSPSVSNLAFAYPAPDIANPPVDCEPSRHKKVNVESLQDRLHPPSQLFKPGMMQDVAPPPVEAESEYTGKTLGSILQNFQK